MKKNAQLARNFRPQQFIGDMLFFAATQGETEPAAYRWKRYVNGKIIVHEVDCEHVHMMKPVPVAKIADVLTSALEKQTQSFK
jgi:thioesterase domain-containing protein